MMTACRECPLRRLDVFRDRNQAEIDFIQAFKSSERTVPPGTTIVAEKGDSAELYTVLSGWVFRYKTLSGRGRQILNFGVPGDFLGLQATLDEAMTHGVESLTTTTLCVFEREKLWSLYAEHPRLAYDMTWLAATQEASLEEQMLTLGKRTAFERVAYLLWYLYDRARQAGLVDGTSVELPIRQQHLADTLGLSLVHTNKTLQKIREDGAIEIRDRCLTVHDEARLIKLGRIEINPNRPRPLI